MEGALALCTLVVFLAVAIGAVSAVASSVRCIDAARELARLTARGDPDRGRAAAEQLAPAGALIEVVVRGDEVVVEVTVPAVPPLPLRVGGSAVAVLEPGVAVGAGPIGATGPLDGAAPPDGPTRTDGAGP